MRYIPQSLKNKCLLLEQNKEHNADPRLEAIISRHVIPIKDYKLWQTSQVANFTGRVSIAVARPDYRRMPNKIYVAGIDDGVAKIYSGNFNGIDAPPTWALEFTIAGVAEISMAFVGRFKPYKRGRTEFYTTEEWPWIFYVDSGGTLWAQYWDDESTKVQLGNDVTSCAATMGVNSVQNEWGYGLLVAWTTTAGAVFYAQYFDNTWSDGIAVTQAPEDVVEVTISRVADWRIIFLVKDSSGATTAMYFRSIAHSMSIWERVEVLDVSITDMSLGPVDYIDAFTTENVEISSIEPGIYLYSLDAPISLEAYNIDDGAGNFGRFVIVRFQVDVFDFTGQQAAFSLTGTGGPFQCLAASRPAAFPRNLLKLEFADFNNSSGELTVNYTPGTLSSGVELAAAFTETFTPTGLIPVYTDPPIVTGIADTSNQAIVLTFDTEVSTGAGAINDNADAFAISGFEPPYFPMGPGVTTSPATYTVSSVEFNNEAHTEIKINLTYAGRLKYPQGDVSIQYNQALGNLRGLTGIAVPSQIWTFDPSSATPWFNPCALEKVELAAVTATPIMTTIYYTNLEPTVERVEVAAVSVTNATLTHVDDL